MQEALLNSFFKRRKRSGRTQFGLSRAGDWAREGREGGSGGRDWSRPGGASQPRSSELTKRVFPPCSQSQAFTQRTARKNRRDKMYVGVE